MTKRRSQNVVSLFPFLAVLVCTMGALILLLLVTTRRIRQKQEEGLAASQSAESVLVATSEQLSAARQALELAEAQLDAVLQKSAVLHAEKLQLEDRLSVRSQGLADMREQLQLVQDGEQRQQGALQQNRESLESAIREHSQLTDQLVSVREQLEQTETQLAQAESLAATAEELAGARRSALDLLRQQSERLQESPVSSGTTETVFDFSNPRGTIRTPIIVDIDREGFLLPSSGVRLVQADLTGFSMVDNPLLSAILTTHRYRSGDSLVASPYVLCLVRPSGILGFYPAQRILSEARIQFGYELISEDETVASPPPVSGEEEAVQLAVRNSLLRRNRQLAGSEDIRRRIAALRAQHAAERSRRTPPPSGTLAPDSRRSQLKPVPWSDNPEPGEVARIDAVPRTNAGGEYRPRRFPGEQDGTPQPSIHSVLNPGLAVEQALQEALANRDARRSPPGVDLSDAPNNPTPANQPLETGEPPTSADRADLTPPRWGEPMARTPNTAPTQAIPGADAARLADGAPIAGTPEQQAPWMKGEPFQSRRQTASSGGQPGQGSTGESTTSPHPMIQPTDSKMTSFAKVTVYLDPQYLTVADREPAALHGQAVSSIVSRLLNDVKQETQLGPEVSWLETIPAVTFVVSPGAHTLYLQVAEQLAAQGIPVSSRVSLESHVEEHTEGVGAAFDAWDPGNRGTPGQTSVRAVSRERERP